jgi:hypothetical protein
MKIGKSNIASYLVDHENYSATQLNYSSTLLKIHSAPDQNFEVPKIHLKR